MIFSDASSNISLKDFSKEVAMEIHFRNKQNKINPINNIIMTSFLSLKDFWFELLLKTLGNSY
jgi:cell division protein FtsB